MSSDAVANPPVAGESKSARKKKAKGEAAEQSGRTPVDLGQGKPWSFH